MVRERFLTSRKMLLTIFGLALLTVPTAAWFHGRPEPGNMTQGYPWPLPKVYTLTSDRPRYIDPASFTFTAQTPGCDVLDQALIRYKKITFPKYRRPDVDPLPELKGVHVYVSDGCPTEVPQYGIDESYKLTAASQLSKAYISAKTVWGALRGLETFSQMFYKDAQDKWWFRPADIIDEPRFPWRGVMLDTARHFLTVGMIKQQIDLMAQNKFNVFHWHIVDHEAFPYTSTLYPNLTKGAYTPKHVYTVDEIKGIVEFARLRGIRVVVEFDTPSHTASWRVGAPPGVMADCYTDATDKKIMPLAGLLDPTQNVTYEFLEAFLKEAQGVFPDNYIHLGGDEVYEYLEPCWLNNKAFMERMRILKFGNSTDKLQQAFFNKLAKILASDKPEKRAVLWEEAFYSKAAPKNSIAQVWRGWQNQTTMSLTLEKVTAAGHETILSSCWYLNYISYGPDWQYLYNCEPHNFNGTEKQKALVIGGEAAFWGEYVDGASLTPLMWPRASAVAERLWSDPAATKNADDAWPRLHEHRCRMLLRGYAVQPPNTPDYCLDPWDPPYPQY